MHRKLTVAKPRDPFITARAAVLGFLFLCAAALQLKPAAAEEEAWSFSITPYLWGASIYGDVTGEGGRPDVPIGVSFSDVLTNLDFALMLAGEAHKDRFSVFGDLIYLDVTSSVPTPFGVLFSSAEVDTKGLIGTIAGAYRLYSSRPGWIDAYAGARILSLSVDIDLRQGTIGPESASFDRTLVDPIVGVRGHMDILDGFGVTALADVGGFGAGTDLSWQILGTVDYAFSDSWVMRVGYRRLSLRFDGDNSAINTVFSGPIAGVSFKF